MVVSLPVGFPILYCWQRFDVGSALWAAVFSALMLFMAVPSGFALALMLQLLIPAAFIAVIADWRPSFSGDRTFIPLSSILSSTSLLVAMSSLVLAVFLNNSFHIAEFLDLAISEMTHILTLMRTLPPQQIILFEMLLRADHHALIIKMFVLYSFIAVLLNFYMASRLGKYLPKARRPRDFWPYNASSLPRIQLILLIVTVSLLQLPINTTLQSCLDIISMALMLSFTLSGLAAIHLITRGKTWRPFLLIALYVGLLPLFASFILVIWGIFVSGTPFLQRYKNHLNSSL